MCEKNSQTRGKKGALLPSRWPCLAWVGTDLGEAGSEDPAFPEESSEGECSWAVPSKDLQPQPSGKEKGSRETLNSVVLLQVSLEGTSCPRKCEANGGEPHLQSTRNSLSSFHFSLWKPPQPCQTLSQNIAERAAKHFWGKGFFLQLCDPRLLPVCCLLGLNHLQLCWLPQSL